jgi:hypothetical protein
MDEESTSFMGWSINRPLDLEQYPMRYIEIKGKNISEKLIYTV